jgi:hypothetical protein
VANPRAQGQALLRLMEAPMTPSPAALATGVGSPVSIDSSTRGELPVLQQGALPASSRSIASTRAGPASWWQQGEVLGSIVIRNWPHKIGRFPAHGAWLGPEAPRSSCPH